MAGLGHGGRPEIAESGPALDRFGVLGRRLWVLCQRQIRAAGLWVLLLCRALQEVLMLAAALDLEDVQDIGMVEIDRVVHQRAAVAVAAFPVGGHLRFDTGDGEAG